MRPKPQVTSPEIVGCKCYRPGDPDFEFIASLVTPLNKIRSELSHTHTFIIQDRAPDFHSRRNESVNDLYTGNSFLSL